MAEQKPRILVTRPTAQAVGQCALLHQLGAEPVELPMLEIVPTAESDSSFPLLKSRILDLDLYHKVIFISSNAVDYGMDLIDQYWPQLPIGTQWFAIGKKTAARLQEYGISAIQSDSGYDSEALLAQSQLQNVTEQKILIMRGSNGREKLAETLQLRGARVDYADLYSRRTPDYTSKQISSTIGKQELSAVLITSGEALQNFTTLVSSAQLQLLHTLIVVPSQRIARIATDLGYTRVIIASGPDNRSMAETVLSNIDTDDRS